MFSVLGNMNKADVGAQIRMYIFYLCEWFQQKTDSTYHGENTENSVFTNKFISRTVTGTL